MEDRNRQLFVLGPEIWSSISRDDIMATAESMHKANINNYPYEEFDILACGETRHIMPWIYEPIAKDAETAGWDPIKKDTIPVTLHFRYYDLSDTHYRYSMGVNVKDKFMFLPQGSPELLSNFSALGDDDADYMNNMSADALLTTLLVMLATKNVDKEVLEKPKRYKDPLSKGGVKQIKNTEYGYITTIKIGKIIDTMRSGDARGHVRPHLRRGHLRNQRIGEGRKDVKQIFIQPVFVNADDGWIENQRKEYRVKL